MARLVDVTYDVVLNQLDCVTCLPCATSLQRPVCVKLCVAMYVRAGAVQHAMMLSFVSSIMLCLVAAGCLPNKGMAHCLSKLEGEVRASGEPNAGFKANAFRKAASVIGTHREKLKSAKEAGKLPGVGKGVMSLIEEYLETGAMGEKDKEKAEEKVVAKENGGKTAAPVKQSAGLAFL